MPLENTLNVSPYFDDFDANKEFYKILFKPGVAVQARELNQLQTLLQNQIERFGNHVFKSGTIISGVNFNYIPSYNYVKIQDTQSDGQPSLPSSYINYFVKSSLNLTARVVDFKDGLETSSPDLKTLYLRYTNSSDPDTANGDAVYTEFSPGQQLTIFGEDYPLFKINVNNGGVGFTNSDSVIIQSSIAIANVSGTFSNGEVITQSTTGAKAVIKAINTTAIACTTILQIAPRTSDLTNNSVNSIAWTFQTGYSIVGNTSSATANVGSLLGSSATALITTDTQGIIQTVTVGNGGSDYTFLPWVTVKTSNATATVNNLDLLAQNYKAKITIANSSTNAVGAGYAFGVSEGLIYQKGYFLKVDPQVIVVEKYDSTPNNVVVGFKTEESYVDSNEDESLLDNASNTSNFAAPGADRLKLTPVLTTLSSADAAANLEFFVLAEWKAGFPYKENRVTVYSNLADEMARRTREAQGNFVVDRFNVTTREKTTTNTSYVDVVIDPGLGYIDGYRVSSSYNNYLDLARSTTTTPVAGQSITVNYGNYIEIKELAGLFDFKSGATVDLYDTAKSFISSVTIPSSGAISPAGTKIGTARIRSLVYDRGEPGTAACVYRLYLFDIAMDPGKSFRQVKSVYYNGTVQDGIGDVVLVNDSTTGIDIAKLIDSKKDTMVFSIGKRGVASVSNVTFTYRTSTNEQTLSTSGEFAIGPLASGLTHPYSDGALSTTQKKDIIIFPVANVEAASNLAATTVSLSSGCSVITGVGTTFNTSLAPGDFVRFANSTANAYYQIASIANATSATLTVNSAVTMSATRSTLFFPALYPIALSSRTGRSVTVSGSSKTATINIGTSTNTTVNAIAIYNVKSSNAAAVTKSVTRDVFVKIHTSNNEAGSTGPWALGVPSTVRLKKVFLGNSSNVGTTTNTTVSDVTKYFFIDYGEDENAYRSAKLVLNHNTSLAVNTNQFILAQFDVLTNGGIEGFFTVSSYPINDTANLASSTTTINTLEIPELYSSKGGYIDLRNAIDFRPVGQNTATLATSAGSANVNPSDTFTLNTDDKFFPVPDSTVTFDSSYYNARRDRVVVQKDGSFKVIQGTPSLSTPTAPDQPPSSVTLAVVNVPPYPSLPRIFNDQTMEFAVKRAGSADGVTDVRIAGSRIVASTGYPLNSNQPKRYTMADIGKIERRVKNVEYAVQLTAVESGIQNLVIPSDITPSTNRFKHGYFVDTFKDFSISELAHREFAAQVDTRLTTLTPSFTQFNVESEFNTANSTTNNAVTNSVLMLPRVEEALVTQVIKNIAIGSDAQDTKYYGSGSISPPSFSIKARGERNQENATVFFIVRDQVFTVTVYGLRPLTTHHFYFERNKIPLSQIKPLNGKLGDPIVADENGKVVFDFYYTSGVSMAASSIAEVQEKVANLGGIKELVVIDVDTETLSNTFEDTVSSLFKSSIALSVYVPPESEFVRLPVLVAPFGSFGGDGGGGGWAGITGGDFSATSALGDHATSAEAAAIGEAMGLAAADGVGTSGFDGGSGWGADGGDGLT